MTSETKPAVTSEAAIDPALVEAGVAEMRSKLGVTPSAIERWRRYPLFAAFACAMALPRDAGSFDKVQAKRNFVAALDHARRHDPEGLDLALSVCAETGEDGAAVYETGRKSSEHMVADVYKMLVDLADSRGVTFVGAECIAHELRIDVSTVRRAGTVINYLQAGGQFDRWRRDDRQRHQVGCYRSHVHFLPILPPTEDDRAPLPRRKKPSDKKPAWIGALPPSAPKLPADPRAQITPQGRDAVLSAVRAHRELAELDTLVHAQAICAAFRRHKHEHLIAKAMAELAKAVREHKHGEIQSLVALACSYARDVLEWGESDEERLAAENADLPSRRVSRETLGKAMDLGAAERGREAVLASARAYGVHELEDAGHADAFWAALVAVGKTKLLQKAMSDLAQLKSDGGVTIDCALACARARDLLEDPPAPPVPPPAAAIAIANGKFGRVGARAAGETDVDPSPS